MGVANCVVMVKMACCVCVDVLELSGKPLARQGTRLLTWASQAAFSLHLDGIGTSQGTTRRRLAADLSVVTRAGLAWTVFPSLSVLVSLTPDLAGLG